MSPRGEEPVPATALANTNPAGVGWIGVVALLVIGVGALVVEPGLGAVRVALACALGGLVVWANLIRPVLLIRGDRLELVNPLSTVSLPLARVDRFVVRVVTVFWVGEQRFTSTAVGRKVRAMARPDRYRVDDPVPDGVEEELRSLVDAAHRRRVSMSADPTVRRSRDWVVLGPMLGLALALVVALAL